VINSRLCAKKLQYVRIWRNTRCLELPVSENKTLMLYCPTGYSSELATMKVPVGRLVSRAGRRDYIT